MYFIKKFDPPIRMVYNYVVIFKNESKLLLLSFFTDYQDARDSLFTFKLNNFSPNYLERYHPQENSLDISAGRRASLTQARARL
jgi:hypothetical protein